jgi:threonine dehydrogenase-like Zn-dependent dehydrogenase
MVLSEPLLIEVPDHVSTEVAALTELLAVAYRTVVRAELASDDVPLVVGCGPIGLAVIAVLKMKGVGPIVASNSHRSGARSHSGSVPTWLSTQARPHPSRR